MIDKTLQKGITTVLLTPEEAVLFVTFQKRFLFMKALEDMGAFNIKGGSIEIHFDGLGSIAKVDKHEHYKIA